MHRSVDRLGRVRRSLKIHGISEEGSAGAKGLPGKWVKNVSSSRRRRWSPNDKNPNISIFEQKLISNKARGELIFEKNR